MRHRLAAVVMLMFFGADWLAAGPPIKIVAQWSAPEGAGKHFDKILAIGIADDRELRHRFEDKLVSHLRGKDIAAVTSYPLVPDLLAPGSREEIFRKIEAEKIDAAITFRLVPLDGRDETGWDAEWKRDAEGGGTLRELIAATLPMKPTKAKRYGVEVTLWYNEPPARLWSGRTATHSRKELRDGVGDLIQDVIQALQDSHKI